MSDSARIASRRIYSGRVLDLDVDTVRFPNGSVGDLEMIRHSGASAVVPFLSDPTSDDPEVLLIRQYRYAAEEFLLEIPAGRLGFEESPESCAERELREETGCIARRLHQLTTIYTTPGFTDERIHLFAATGLTRGETNHEPDEFISLEALRMSRVHALIESGGIVDGKTVVGLMLASRLATAIQ